MYTVHYIRPKVAMSATAPHFHFPIYHIDLPLEKKPSYFSNSFHAVKKLLQRLSEQKKLCAINRKVTVLFESEIEYLFRYTHR